MLQAILSGFNPYKGFKPIATLLPFSVNRQHLVSIPIRVLSRSRQTGLCKVLAIAWSCFNPYKGFKPIATSIFAVRSTSSACFNPYKGFKPIATRKTKGGKANMNGFNPYKGFKPIATSKANDMAIAIIMFQSL